LGELGDKKAGVFLVKALRDPLASVRGTALVSLGKLRYREALGEIKRLLNDKNPGVRADAVAVLLEFQEPFASVAETVKGLMDDKDPSIRARIAQSLVKSAGQSAQDALTALRRLLQDSLPLPRMVAARALGHAHLARDQAVAILKEALRDHDEAVRATAAGALIRWLDGKAGTNLRTRIR
jgi:HEAT repeat protein